MNTELVCTIISGICTIIVAYISTNNAKHIKKSEERAKVRTEAQFIQMKMQSANTKLTDAVAVAIKRGYANGEVEEAQKQVEEAEAEYEDFIKKQAAKTIAKN